MDVLIRLLNPLLMILGPLALGIFIVRRWLLRWRLFFLGAVTFVGSQVLHIPFNQFVLLPLLDKLDRLTIETTAGLVLYAIALGLSAGVFEEGARYLVYRKWLSNVRRWREAVLFGAGHGGVEAILLGGLALYAFFQATAYRGVDLAEVVPPEHLELAKAQIEAYWSAPWYLSIMGAIERTFAIVIQISLSVLVFQSIVRRKLAWLVLAVAWHALVDAVAVVGITRWGVYATEVAVAGFAVISLVFIRFLRDESEIKAHDATEDDQPPLQQVLPVSPAELDLSQERLENTRYEGRD